jgi:hypothetical protein
MNGKIKVYNILDVKKIYYINKFFVKKQRDKNGKVAEGSRYIEYPVN